MRGLNAIRLSLPVALAFPLLNACGPGFTSAISGSSSSSTTSSTTSSSTCQASSLVDNSSSLFESQTLSSYLDWDSTNDWLTMNSTSSAALTSRIFKTCTSSTAWSNLSWTTALPTYKELPNSGSDETTNSYSAIYSSTLMNSIVAIYHLDDSSTSSTIADSSGNGNTGTIHGGVTLGGTGKFNTAATLDGSTEYLQVASTSLIATQTNGTISLWVTGPATVTQSQPYYTEAGVFYIYRDSAQKIYFNQWRSGVWSGFHVGLPSGQTWGSYVWNHLAFTWSGTDSNIYFNGQLAGSYNQPGAAVAGGVTWSSLASDESGTAIQGSLDEVAIWSRELKTTEIQQLYLRGAAQLKFQVRAWNPSSYPKCIVGTETGGVCPTFIGPDGTSSTYFTELSNTTTSSPTLSLSGLVSGQYFQYQANYSTDSTNSTGTYPELQSVTIAH